MKSIFTFFLLFLLLLACNNDRNDSSYGNIYDNPLFAGITDSINHDRNNDELYFRRAVLLNENNFPEPALADFRKAWSIRKKENYALGVGTLLQDRKPDSAITFLVNALRDLPGSIMLELSLAHAYDAKGNLAMALQTCENILSRDPEQVDVLKLKADLQERNGDKAGAINTLEKAYSIASFDVELNYELASQYADAKNPKVLALCDSLIRSDTDTMNLHAEPFYFKGIYYANLGEKEKAINMFDIAITRNYYYLNAYIEKGRAQLDQRKTNEALKTFNLALTLSPKFPDAYFWIGKCQEVLGLKADAKLNYQRAYSLDQEFTEAKQAADRL